MKRVIFLTFLVLLLAGFGCGTESSNQTESFLGEYSDWQDSQIQLRDVHGLFGGVNLFISGSGKTIIELVGDGLNEKRYELSLTETEHKNLINLFIENDFVNININNREGLPDEAKAEIILINSEGKISRIAKWESDKNSRFDKIYQQITQIQYKTKNTTPILERKWDWNNFVPEGYYKETTQESQDNSNQYDIYYSFGVGEKNILNTKNEIYTKDMVCEPSLNYTIRLSESEKSMIYNAVLENDLFNIKEDLTKNCDENGICRQSMPLSTATLIVTLNGKVKTIKWSYDYIYSEDAELKRFMSLQRVIEDILSKKEKERNIKQPTCGYM